MENRHEAAQRQIMNPAFTARLADKAITACIVLGVSTAVLGGWALYGALSPVKPIIVASNGAGALVPIRRLDEPILTRLELLDWARGCAVKTYFMNYVDYAERQQEAQTCFTPAAWNGWSASFERSFKAIIENKLVAEMPTPLCPAKITSEGHLGDRYAWMVEMPMRITWVNASGAVKSDLVVEMTVVRSEDPENRRGIAFSQFVAAKAWRGECR